MSLGLRQMKTQFLVGILGGAVLIAGCVSSLDGRKHAGVPFVKDHMEGRYERPADQAYAAAVQVIKFNGTLLKEGTIHGTNQVRVIEGKVNQRSVWVRVEPVDPKTSSVIVQARTSGGGKDIELVHELEKQIALQLAR
jgi:hypothetical protein